MSPLLLSLQNVSSRRWDRIVVKDLNWKFHKGECWGVIGPNGAGKTSLVGLIQDQLPYFRGTILRSGFPSGLPGIIKVSFEQQQKIIAHEARKKRYEAFSGIEEHLITVRELFLQTDTEPHQQTGPPPENRCKAQKPRVPPPASHLSHVVPGN